MAHSAFHMSRGAVLCSIRGAGIVPWFIVLLVLSLFAFGLILIVKGADIFLSHLSPAYDAATHEEELHGTFVPICDIFIRTYEKDYPWLEYCLKSIQKFCTGFRQIWIVSPQLAPDGLGERCDYDHWIMMNDETEDGYLAQQITKLYADTLTNYQPDYILHVDSDVIFTQPTTPRDFFVADLEWLEAKPIWPFTPYSAIQTPWQPITEKFMGEAVENEFMRRFPIIIPRWLYPRLREFCHKSHGRVISQYIHTQPPRAFSEFNALGAYAFKYHHDKFFWINTVENPLPPPYARQFFSHGGITPEVKAEIEQILSGGVERHATATVEKTVETATPPCGSVPASSASTSPAQNFEENHRRPISQPAGKCAEVPCSPTAPPPVTFSERKISRDERFTLGDMHEAICKLKDFAGVDRNHRMRVMVNLAKSGLTPRWPKRKKKKTKK